jgi:hypothetical protein
MLQGLEHHQSSYAKVREQELMRSRTGGQVTHRIRIASIQVSLEKLRVIAPLVPLILALFKRF